MSQLRTGVIGLGEVAQIVHLPVLQALPEQFELRAVCDISPTLLDVVGDRYAAQGRYATASELLANEDLDCVLVLSSDEYHTEAVLAALDRGVNVLVEKPMCLNVREAEQIIAARDRSGCTVMVGYMRRFAPAFEAAKQKVAGLGRINFARVHDVIGRNQLIVDQTATVVRPGDIPGTAVDERWTRGSRQVQDAIGSVGADLGGVYRLLCGLGSHDLSAMRELLGRPRGIAAARHWRGGAFLAALIEYDDFVVTYETGVDEQLRFDAHLEVYGERSCVRVQYDTPYVRHFPTTLITEDTTGTAFSRTVVRPNLKDPYTHELEYFHRAITEGLAVKTSPEDFCEDLGLFAEIIRHLRAATS